MKLGYVELTDDPRYADRGAHSGIVFTDLGRPYPGSRLALEDAQAVGRVIGVEFSMEKATAASDDELVDQISSWETGDGIHFVLADLPAADLKNLARRLAIDRSHSSTFPPRMIHCAVRSVQATSHTLIRARQCFRMR